MGAIRKAVQADLEAIENIATESYSIYVKRMNQPPAPMQEDYGKLIQNQEIYVLESADTVIGFLVLIIKEEVLFLDNIAVSPSHQGKGFGGKLMSFAEDAAKLQGFSEIHLYTNVKMVENIELYRHLGWAEYERRTVDDFDRVYMKKHLV